MRTFSSHNILSWVIDDFGQLDNALKYQGNNDLNRVVKRYGRDVYQRSVQSLFTDAPFKLNLGGETEKSKLVTTDKPMGIFDFSLASRGLYRVPEYYSQRLADEKPDRFDGYELPSGVVPPNFVTQTFAFGKNVYSFIDGDETYNCIIRQKGESAIDQGVKGAKKKFATRNRKVYLTYKRNRGKVKYVEIYSLFYYTSLAGDLEFAIRHIPAMMVADYFESIGIKVRFYMTRFVDLGRGLPLRSKLKDGTPLPMYKKTPNIDQNGLFIQPIIAKEFGQEFDKEIGLATSSSNYSEIYEDVATFALKTETTSRNPAVIGNPDWCSEDYYEGFERYRNKYQEYVKLGIYKSKEVTSDAMLFFHDMVIKTRFTSFLSSIRSNFSYFKNKDKTEALSDININGFFVWWMKTSANVLKHKVNILNSNDYRKDLAEIEKDILKNLDELDEILKSINPNINSSSGETLKTFLTNESNALLGGNRGTCNRGFGSIYGYNIKNNKGEITFRTYIIGICNEITTYAEDGVYPTSDEQKEYRDKIFNDVIEALGNFSYTI